MKRLRVRKIVSRVMFWGGILVIGILAVPAGIMAGILFLIGEAVDFILKKIDRD